MPVSPEIIGPTTLAITQAISSFNTFLPDLASIRKKTPDDDPAFAGDVRMGEIAAVALTIGIGTIMSGLTGDPTPALVSLLVSVALVILYESTLRGERPMEGVVVNVGN